VDEVAEVGTSSLLSVGEVILNQHETVDGQPMSGASSPDLVAFRNGVLGASNSDRGVGGSIRVNWDSAGIYRLCATQGCSKVA
jgi:hypothetical protein